MPLLISQTYTYLCCQEVDHSSAQVAFGATGMDACEYDGPEVEGIRREESEGEGSEGGGNKRERM